uniref:Uncharacterized protein n=1 Tax=Calidris pygmaea TaxID=425635 RepID=A0A8C3KJH2_9CHAR
MADIFLPWREDLVNHLQLVCWKTLSYIFTRYCASWVVGMWLGLSMLCLLEHSGQIRFIFSTPINISRHHEI